RIQKPPTAEIPGARRRHRLSLHVFMQPRCCRRRIRLRDESVPRPSPDPAGSRLAHRELMELFAGAPLLLSLAVLALVDSLSIGTLLIPVFLLVSPGRVRVGRVLLYLTTIAVFYLAVGLLFLWGLVNVADAAAEILASPAGTVGRLVVAGALLYRSILRPGSHIEVA